VQGERKGSFEIDVQEIGASSFLAAREYLIANQIDDIVQYHALNLVPTQDGNGIVENVLASPATIVKAKTKTGLHGGGDVSQESIQVWMVNRGRQVGQLETCSA